MEIKLTCPLGSDCEVAKDGHIERCRWYTKLTGKSPQSEEYIDTWDCAMSWLPIMVLENAQTNRGQTEALCSMRDEAMKGQEEFNGIMREAISGGTQQCLSTK